MLPNRYLGFRATISYSTLQTLLSTLMRPSVPPRVFIDSDGGDFAAIMNYAPAIQRRGLTTLAGDLRSSAVTLALLGHHRQALPEATFFFHEPSTTVDPFGMLTISQIEELLDYRHRISPEMREFLENRLHYLRWGKNRIAGFIHDRTGVSSGLVLTLMNEEVTLSAREALSYGLVHEIITPVRPENGEEVDGGLVFTIRDPGVTPRDVAPAPDHMEFLARE